MSDVFGADYARAYDALYREKDYSAECDLLERIFTEYGAGPVRDILDLGCGTGNHALRLAGRGYRVTGVDHAPEMLAIAREKAGLQETDVLFHEADLRELRLNRTFDAALMMFAVLGYQLENADVLSALSRAREHLHAGGLFVADFWYGPAVLAQRPEDRSHTVNEGDVTVSRHASAKLDIVHHTCRVQFNLRRKRGETILTETNEEHTMRFFFPQELALFLQTSRFQLLRLGAFPGFLQEPDESTWNAMLVARAM